MNISTNGAMQMFLGYADQLAQPMARPAREMGAEGVRPWTYSSLVLGRLTLPRD